MRDSVVLFFIRAGYAGLSPIAPGTAGSLLAVVAAPWLFMPWSFPVRVAVLACICIAGAAACTRAEEILQEEDPQQAVIDEVAGQWVTCLPFASMGVWEYIAAFLLFRLFDIFKPWPVSACERFPKGIGIMMDDIAAGVYAMICLGLLRWTVGGY